VKVVPNDIFKFGGERVKKYVVLLYFGPKVRRARKVTNGSIRNELGYRTRIPCIRICLYNRCTCLEVLREGYPDRKIQEHRSQRCWAISAFSVKNHSTMQKRPERTQTNNNEGFRNIFDMEDKEFFGSKWRKKCNYWHFLPSKIICTKKTIPTLRSFFQTAALNTDFVWPKHSFWSNTLGLSPTRQFCIGDVL